MTNLYAKGYNVENRQHARTDGKCKQRDGIPIKEQKHAKDKKYAKA